MYTIVIAIYNYIRLIFIIRQMTNTFLIEKHEYIYGIVTWGLTIKSKNYALYARNTCIYFDYMTLMTRVNITLYKHVVWLKEIKVNKRFGKHKSWIIELNGFKVISTHFSHRPSASNWKLPNIIFSEWAGLEPTTLVVRGN